MNTCPNCGSQLGCTCQLRTTVDGVTKCTNCINAIEITPTVTEQNVEHIHIELNAQPPTQSDQVQ